MKKFFVLAIGLALMGQGCLARPQPASPSAPAYVPAPAQAPSPAPAPVETSEQNMPPQEDTTPPPPRGSSTYNVAIQNFAFVQPIITVKKGDKIIFQNRDSVGHTVTADGDGFDSPLLLQNQTYTLDTSDLAPGSYPYHCTPHPNMRATIVIE
ncbi:MAG: plastocyanin/azurin family copper-binding protein [Patescibacteria group bacterium]